jgi:hypothetical protein
MQAIAPNRTIGLTLIAVLSLVQSALGVLRALHWFDIGSDLTARGSSIRLPVIGIAVFLGGTLIVVLTLLYMLFAFEIFLHGVRALWLGMAVAVANLLLVYRVIAQGGPLNRSLLWGIIPLIIVIYAGARASALAITSIKSKKD